MMQKIKLWNEKVDQWAPVISRVFVAVLFLYLGWLKISQFGDFVTSLSSLPILPGVAWALITIAIEVACGAMLLVGYKTRLASVILFLFMILVGLFIILIKHPPFTALWLQAILPNLGLFAALLLVSKHGSERYSLDQKMAASASTAV